MPINKIDRKELKEKIVKILSESGSFIMLSSDKEINPCRISFDGMEFYIYIKNLSPAQLSNDNPDVWRIQLPIKDDFNQIKETDIPFIALGYDDENKVFTTWNPYWVKQRLNAAKSVSLYSRFSLHKITKETQQLQKLNLNNDGEVVAFPCSKLNYYLANIKSYFPKITEYVAVGSRKRTEANAAYRCLCDGKNISNYATYLAWNGLQERTIKNYCRAIKKLINDGYFSHNRKIFLACDSLAEYPNVVKTFFDISEVAELNDISHNTYSASLKAYINFLIKTNNINVEEEVAPNDVSQNEDDLNNIIETELNPETKENVDWESLFIDSTGKLTRIANPQLLDLLRPVLDTEYRKLPAAYNIITEFYGDRFPNTVMQLKDWNNLFNQINWKSPYYMPTEQLLERNTSNRQKIKVVLPNGTVICHNIVSETFLEVVKYAGVEKVRNLKIKVAGDNMIVSKEYINPKYEKTTKYVGHNLYCFTNINTAKKAEILKQISKQLNLDLIVEVE